MPSVGPRPVFARHNEMLRTCARAGRIARRPAAIASQSTFAPAAAASRAYVSSVDVESKCFASRAFARNWAMIAATCLIGGACGVGCGSAGSWEHWNQAGADDAGEAGASDDGGSGGSCTTTCASGCCDTSGNCQSGALDNACGSGAQACVDCTATGGMCQSGSCSGSPPASSGSPGSSSSSGGSNALSNFLSQLTMLFSGGRMDAGSD